MKNTNINIPAFIVIILYPMILAVLAFFYCRHFKFGTFEILCIIFTYYIANISVGVGFHRLWSHAAYKTKPWVEVVLAFITAGTLQGPALAWASDHMVHHQYTDEEKDPHSALKYKNKILGFLWSHMGWMIFTNTKEKKIERITLAKLGKNKVVMWQFKHYWKIAIFMNLLPLLIGYIIGGNVQYAISAFIFMGIGRAIQQQATFCVNSLVHTNIGTKQYYYGTATDIWWLFFLLLGENWHNFHHAFANDYRNGPKWYHLDIHKWVIALMAKLKLATDLVITSEQRIDAMVKQVRKKTLLDMQTKLNDIEKISSYIYNTSLTKLKAIEKSATKLAADFKDNLNILVEKSAKIIKNSQDLKKLKESSLEEKVLKNLTVKLDELKKIAFKVNIKFQTT